MSADHEHAWYAIPDPGGYVGEECRTCGLNRDNYERENTDNVIDRHDFAASDGGVPMIFRSSKASQHGDTFPAARSGHKVSCAGCDCEPGTTCDTKKRCDGCEGSKTACDANKSVTRDTCCRACSHG